MKRLLWLSDPMKYFSREGFWRKYLVLVTSYVFRLLVVFAIARDLVFDYFAGKGGF